VLLVVGMGAVTWLATQPFVARRRAYT